VSRILAVASGKGGTGKTSISVNLSLALGRMGRKVCLLDADLGLSNVDVLLGISPKLTLEHVLFEGLPMEQVLVPAAPRVDVVPGGSGVSRLADLSREARLSLANEFAKLEGYDYLVVDGSPGVSSQVIAMCLACPELLVVVNPDPASITDAYALVKVLSENGMRRSPYLTVNRARSREYARDIFARLRGAMAKYLKLDARFLGYIPSDPHMSAASARQRPLVDLYPASSAGLAVLELAKSLDALRPAPGAAGADPASVMEGAVVRMREFSRNSGDGGLGERSLHALDEAMKLADILGRPGLKDGRDGRGKAAERLKSLLLALRDEARPRAVDIVRPRPEPRTKPPRVAVISSDVSIGDILSESLVSLGYVVAPAGAAVQAAVVYWNGAQSGSSGLAVLSGRLAQLGDAGYIYVRGVASENAPIQANPPGEILDMPFKIEDLGGAVKRVAAKFADRRGYKTAGLDAARRFG
jgi:flagellar biosynthesis protein FlhG